MVDTLLTCLDCGVPLPEPSETVTGPRQCPHCSAYYELATFPALFRQHGAGIPAENVMAEGESSCLYHPAKKASVVCKECGAFLCTLCDIDFEGNHICPRCLTRREYETGPGLLLPETTRYESIAFHLAVWPLFFTFLCVPFVMLFTAPLVLYLVVRHWNVSRLPDGSPSAAMSAAAILAGLELLLALGAILVTMLAFLPLFGLEDIGV